jgi:predicted dehydrogenase
MKILVVGAGSVGKRHLKNLQQLGVSDLTAVDTREDRLEEIKTAVTGVKGVASLEAALKEKFDGAVVAAPPHVHVSIGRLLIEKKIPILMEKPLADREEGVRELLEKADQNKIPIVTGYTYRFWPPLVKISQLLDQKPIGRILSVRIEVSEYLPDWHPWEDYRDFFMAKKEQGGGALLDESHMIDIALWLFGEIEEIFCVNEKLSSLEITTDDLAEMIVKFKSGAVGSLHMDIFGRAHQKGMTVIGDEGNLIWDPDKNEVRLFRAAAKAWETFPFVCERNEMFLEEAKHFIAVIKGQEKPRLNGWDGYKTLQYILAARDSARQKKSLVMTP